MWNQSEPTCQEEQNYGGGQGLSSGVKRLTAVKILAYYMRKQPIAAILPNNFIAHVVYTRIFTVGLHFIKL